MDNMNVLVHLALLFTTNISDDITLFTTINNLLLLKLVFVNERQGL